MLRNSLAQSCLTFLTVVAVAGVIFLGLFFASIGMLKLPEEVSQIPATLEAWSTSRSETHVEVLNDDQDVAWSDSHEELGEPTILVLLPTDVPTPESTPTPYPTTTPVPPLDPSVYRVETTERLKTYSKALKQWIEYNQTLSEDTSRLSNPDWQAGMRSALLELTTSGNSLAEVGPAPQEYNSVDAVLDSVAAETGRLASDYNQAMKTGDLAYLKEAGDDFTRLKAYLQQAAEQMLALGWDL